MIILLAEFIVQDGHINEVLAGLEVMAAKVKTEEPRCHMFEISQHSENAQNIIIYEKYEDMAAIEEHRETAHYAELGKTIRHLLAERTITYFDVKID